MKKLILGLVIGMLIGSASIVVASSDYVEAVFSKFNFEVNGDMLELEADPLVYQGTTYLPVRVISNSLGYDVTYKADSKTIILDSQGSKEMIETKGVEPMSTPTVTLTQEELESIERVEKQILSSEQRIIEFRERISGYGEEIVELNGKIASSSSETEKIELQQLVRSKQDSITGVEEEIQMAEDGITAQLEYINKLRNK